MAEAYDEIIELNLLSDDEQINLVTAAVLQAIHMLESIEWEQCDEIAAEEGYDSYLDPTKHYQAMNLVRASFFALAGEIREDM